MGFKQRMWIWLACGLLLAACQTAVGGVNPPVAEEPMPTLAEVAALPTVTALPTLTPIPTSTLTPTPASTSSPPTPTPTLPPTFTLEPTAVADAVDRSCPDPAPAKPFYGRNRLTERIWPIPQPGAEEHFWLQKPLPGGGRFLFNIQFPYGFDASGAYLLHNGVDSAEPLGTPLLAVADGTVIVAGKDDAQLYGWRCDWYGELVVLELARTWRGQPIYALYGHVLNINVAVGDVVRAGEQVAEVGFGGAATVPHLHFEVRVGTNEFSSTRNPMLWIQPPESRGVVAGRLIDPNGRSWRGIWLMARHLESGHEAITWSYLDDPQQLINPDEQFAENFVFADLPPGPYRIYVQIQAVNYQADVEVVGGGLTTVEIRTEGYKTPTPTPEVSPAPTPTPEP